MTAALLATSPPVPSIDELVSRSQQLASPPGLVIEILRQVDDERCSVASLSRTISRDPGLASKLVRMANSAMFAPSTPVTTIDRAVTMLGLRSVKLMVLSLSLDSLLPTARVATAEVALARRRSLVNAVLSRRFVSTRLPVLGEEVFLVGLIGHLGRIGLAQTAPEAFAHLVRAGQGWSRPEDERAVLGITGDELTVTMFERWSLPPRLIDALRHRHPVDTDVPAGLAPMVDALRLGLLGEEVLCGSAPGPALAALRTRAGSELGLSAEHLDDLLIGTEPVLEDLARLLDVTLPPDTSHEELIARAVAQIAALSAGTAAEVAQGRRRSQRLANENKRLSSQSRIDPLTGLGNRGGLDDYLHRQLAGRRRRRWDDVLGLLLVDLDRFKDVNDSWGHIVGDDVLRAVGALLSRITRRDEFAARYGGDEFVLVLPHTTPGELTRAAERICRAICELQIGSQSQPVRVTASIGGACTVDAAGDDPAKALIERADAKLYEAKRAGRNTSRLHLAPA